jgi:hypothetical protein
MKPILWATACLFSCAAAISYSWAADSPGGAVISGVVRDGQSQPVPGATISVVASSRRPKTDFENTMLIEEIGRAQTNRDGRFELTVRKPTAADIAIELSAGDGLHGVALKDLGTKATRHELALTLPPAAAQTVTVISPDGTPLAGAKVKLFRLQAAEGTESPQWYVAPPSGVSAWPSPLVTGEDGKINLKCGETVVGALLEIDDDRVARQVWTVETKPAKQQTPITLRCLPPRVVDGEVVAADGRAPLAGAKVALTSWEGHQHVGEVVVTTDVRGKFNVRPYAGDRLTIRAQAGVDGYKRFSEEIPWIDGTLHQRMVLPLYRPGKMALDGTTADGRPAGTIDVETPTVKVEESHPAMGAVVDSLQGTLVVSEHPLGGSDNEERIVALSPTMGRSRVLVEHGQLGRVSADGKQISYVTTEPKDELAVAVIDRLSDRRLVANKCAGAGCWVSSPVGLVVTTNAARPTDYFGQKYWPLQFDKRKVGVDGADRGKLTVPTAYEVFDVSPDGRLVALYCDTHSSKTGAQAFVADLSGDHLRPIARRRSQYYWYPRFSPDGKSIVAKHLDAKGGALTVHIVALDGSHERSISLGKGLAPEGACWSPDGKWILIIGFDEAVGPSKNGSQLFVADVAGERIAKVRMDSKELRQVTSIDWTAAMLTAEQ